MRCATCSLVVFLLSLPAIADATAASTAEPDLRGELERQERIYHGRGLLAQDGYVVDRSLLLYVLGFAGGFERELGNLGPEDRWLDIGAGEGRAVLDYATGRYTKVLDGRQETGTKRAQAVALSIEDRRTAAWREAAARGDANVAYLAGRRLREYGPGELGTFRLVTDMVGGFSYTADLSLFVGQVLSMLEVNGTFYTILADVRSEDGGNAPYYENAPFLTEIVTADRAPASVCSWLKRIPCVEVTCEAKDWQPPGEAYRVHKVCEQTIVPRLAPEHFRAGTPPERRFRLKP